MLLTNLTLLNDEVLEEKRVQICNGCEFYTPLKTCTKCSCFMLAKIKFKYAECPENKWPNISQPEA